MEVWNVKGKLLKGVLSLGIGLGVLYGGSSAQADTSTDQNNILKVMTHNVYMLSTNLYPNWGQSQRADLIGAADYIKNQDVVILNEVFDNSASDRLLGNLKKEYPNQTAVLGRSNGNEWDKTLGSYSSSTPEDGGVAIVSKWPIVEKVQYVFANGCGPDNLSNKGFVYTKIKKNDRFVHVIGTHLQAEDSMCGKTSPASVRTNQLKEIQDFIKNKNIPNDEYVLFGGDMNVNKINAENNSDSEYASMFKTLHASIPSYTGHTATWDATTNSIAKYNFPDSPAEYLDYIIASKDHANPSFVENKVLQPKSPQWTVTSWLKKYTYDDYSDHYPVAATISMK
ncbi:MULTISPECIES: sphingomyelinase C [Bacillus cereus group]|uniref:Sphingomyelinase C n=1 Tax=Bacillus cereus (strain Q1) TaxID=361100 RepID=B9J4W8_BACCQ|nr:MULTISPECIES: sphingomyelinase C [Bacillus cereus group]ACM11198.1 sphingomyelinase C [Bacillus cereus Q1]MCR6795035.1 sphingomyelinase C [Bacillus paranthracis]MCU5201536.1 sphingomyelinase C [Bacillus paranthracis]MCX3320778.1 sphingomyelinase C [Bacillus paranthracis]MCY9250239.1 sphingomyelinase C [Bacillus paranthracis]